MTRTKNTITINGKVYDALSGLPVAAPTPIAAALPKAAPATPAPVATSTSHVPHHPAKAVHRTPQKSQTLRRQILKRPAHPHIDSVRRTPQPGHVNKSSMISKFAPHPQPIPKKVAAAPAPVAPPVHHPIAARAHAIQSATTKPTALSSRELKQKLIADRLASIDTSTHHREHKPAKRPFFSRTPRVSTIVAASFAVIILGAYLTYINMPNLSMRVAAASSGVNGSFPEYKPDGYRFNGPITYIPGEINLSFASNTNQNVSYTITQKSSSWDSQAVLDNYVAQKSTHYDTYSEQGLTIYTYGNNAAWVNGGTFYTIEGNAPLSNSQILRIAASM